MDRGLRDERACCFHSNLTNTINPNISHGNHPSADGGRGLQQHELPTRRRIIHDAGVRVMMRLDLVGMPTHHRDGIDPNFDLTAITARKETYGRS